MDVSDMYLDGVRRCMPLSAEETVLCKRVQERGAQQFLHTAFAQNLYCLRVELHSTDLSVRGEAEVPRRIRL